MKKIIFAGFFLCIFFGFCSYPIDEFPPSEDKLVIQCEFTNDKEGELWIFKGVGFSNLNHQPGIPDSINLSILKNGESVKLQKSKGPNTHYKLKISALPDDEISLTASLQNSNVKEVFAKTYIPPPVSFDSIIINDHVFENIAGIDMIRLPIEIIVDDTNHVNYFEVLAKFVTFGNIDSHGDTIWNLNCEEKPLYKSNRSDNSEGVKFINERKSFIIDGNKFSGHKIDVSYSCSGPGKNDVAMLSFSLRGLTKDGYLFIKSFYNTSPYSLEFPVLNSNIENGIGIFTGYSQTDHIVILDLR